MLIIVGQIASDQEGRGGFQDSSGHGTRVDAETIFASVAVAVRKLRSADAMPAALQKLLTAAMQDRGPAVLLVPRELWNAPLTSSFPLSIPPCLLPMPAASAISAAQKLIQNSRQILVVAGKDVLFQGYQKFLCGFVRQTGAWVAVTADGKGLWDHSAEEFVGLVGVMGHRSADAAWDASDLIVLVGTSLPMMSRPSASRLSQKTLLQLHSRTGLSCEAAVLSLVGAMEPTLRHLTPVIKRPFSPPPESVTILPSAYHTNKVPMLDAIASLSEHFAEAPVFVDAGNVGAAAIHGFHHRGQTVFSVALGMGGMGHSFGCAIGAAVCAKQRSLVIAGDGSFYMYGLEIHTAWEYQLPITFVIFNNNAHAMCQIREHLYLGPPGRHNAFRPSQLGAGMRAMLPDIPAFDISRLEQLQSVLKETEDHAGPIFISIETDPTEPPPFLPFRSVT